MAVTLTHTSLPARDLAARDIAVRKSPKSAPSLFARLIAFLTLPAEIFRDARHEMQAAHERFPFVEW